MRAVVQRVLSASVTIDNKQIASIGLGLLVLLGIKKGDTKKDADRMIHKLLNLRIFPGNQPTFDKNVVDGGGEILLVSQFTLYGDCSKGNRPSFVDAMQPQQAELLYNDFVSHLKKRYPDVKEGVFGAHMQVSLINDGPVTIILGD